MPPQALPRQPAKKPVSIKPPLNLEAGLIDEDSLATGLVDDDRAAPPPSKSLGERISDFAGTYSAKDEELDRALSLGGLVPPPLQVAKGAASGVLGLGRMVSSLIPKSPLDIATAGARSMVIEPIAAEHERYVAARDRPAIQGGQDVAGMVRHGIGQVPLLGPIASGLAERSDPGIESLEQGQRPAPVAAATEALTMALAPEAIVRVAGLAARGGAQLVRAGGRKFYEVGGDIRRFPQAKVMTAETTKGLGEQLFDVVNKERSAPFEQISERIGQPVAMSDAVDAIVERAAQQFKRTGEELPAYKDMPQPGEPLTFDRLVKIKNGLYRMSRSGALQPDMQGVFGLASKGVADMLDQIAGRYRLGPEYTQAKASYADFMERAGPESDFGAFLEAPNTTAALDMLVGPKGENILASARALNPALGDTLAGAVHDLKISGLGRNILPGGESDVSALAGGVSQREMAARRLQGLAEGLAESQTVFDPGQTQYAAGLARLTTRLPIRSAGFRRFLTKGMSEEPYPRRPTIEPPIISSPPPAIRTTPFSAAPVPPGVLPSVPAEMQATSAPFAPEPAVGARLGVAPDMLLRNQLARDQFGKGYIKLMPQERQLIDQIASQVERGQQ